MDGSDSVAGSFQPAHFTDVDRVVAWFSDAHTREMLTDYGITTSWKVEPDSDGSLLLLPIAGPEPGFALIPAGREIEVLVGDADREIELGPFPTWEDALTGIAHWLASDTDTRH